MNGAYFPNAQYPGDIGNNNLVENSYLDEQGYIENILRLNKGKKVKAYFTFPNSNEWRDKVFEGIIEQVGKDHLIMSDPNTGKWQLILLIYLNYIEYDEFFNYAN